MHWPIAGSCAATCGRNANASPVSASAAISGCSTSTASASIAGKRLCASGVMACRRSRRVELTAAVKTSLVIGAGGQDGSFLVELLQRRGDTVVSLSRSGVKSAPPMDLPATDILSRDQVFELVRRLKPDEIYYLAAYQHSSEDVELQSNDSLMFERSYAVNTTGVIHFLDAVAQTSPTTRLFYAASSHIFGAPATQPQTELTPMNPESVYGITKPAGIHACRHFRR